jgi:SAM-dependent methyltransferase
MQDVAAAALVPLMRIGDQLGLFKKLSQLGEVSCEKFASEAEVDERYLREWLFALSAAGFVSYNKDEKTFHLSSEQAAVFSHEEGPANMIGAYDVLTGAVHNEEGVKKAFKTGEGVPYEDACPICFQGTARFFKPSYQTNLIKKWLPLIEGFDKKMSKGGSFADIGCGHGLSTLMVAEAFPLGKVSGFDIHGPSIEEAKKIAEVAGFLEKINYGVADAKSYQGKFDYIAFFDCLHDMGDPVGAAKYAFDHLNDEGVVILIEPTASDNPEDNFNVFGQMYYSFSTMGCIPTSKSQEVGLSLGAQAGPTRLIQALTEAGFKNCKVVKKNASNMVLEARKS